MRASFTLSAVLFVALFVIAEPPKPSGDRIVAADARWELLYTRDTGVTTGLTEGPAAAPDGSVYFTDIPTGRDKGRILRFDPKTRKTTVFAADSLKANGLEFDAQGRLIACEGSDCGGRCVSRYDIQTGEREIIADKFNGKRFNAPNDLAIDLKGRIYFTDPRYLGPEKRELEHRAVYRIDSDGSVIQITHECEKPNGIAISPDQKTLYVADHNNGTDIIDPNAPPPKKGAMKFYSFPLGPDGKVNGPRKTLIDFGTEDGIDGITVDVEGNVYLTVRALKRPGIMVIEPSGKEIAFIPTGPSQSEDTKAAMGLPSNVVFGVGDESKVLYATVDKSLYRIRLKVDGYRIPSAK